MSQQDFEKKIKRQTELLAVERERVDVCTRKRFSIQLPIAFLFSLLFTLAMILLKGLGLIMLSDTVIISLLGYTVAYVPVMLIIMLKQLYNQK